MKKKIVMSALLLMLVACGGLKKDYVVLEQSRGDEPKWLGNNLKSERKENPSLELYYGDANGANKTICEKGAEAKAKTALVEYIEENIESGYKQAASEEKSANDSNKNEEALARTLSTKISKSVTGVKVNDKYWEKVQHQVKLGAEKEFVEYKCHALLSMDKAKLQTEVDKALVNVDARVAAAIKKEFAE
ncbi:MAG: hypothetical protein Ta2D_06320 [Rickettsiales bacterium]|nr:MAG: hypothetical protein Ta2D_06320 [Rickettsiales bacterium]